jgi:hypothetical protein
MKTLRDQCDRVLVVSGLCHGVSTSANQEGSSQDQPREVEQAEKTSPGKRRTTKPNTRYYGPDWFSK